jgi:hypothetical protein
MELEALLMRMLSLVNSAAMMAFILSLSACGTRNATETSAEIVVSPEGERDTEVVPPTEFVSPTDTAIPPSQTPLPPLSNTPTTQPEIVFVSPQIPTTLENIYIEIPEDWYWTQVDTDGLEGLLFVVLEPDELEEFDDPELALPADFAGGALVITPLPGGSDPEAMQAGMTASLPELSGQDLEGMLIGADRVGLINLIAIDYAILDRAWSDEISSRPAIVMEGAVHFLDNQPPVIQTQIWLTWTHDAFIAYYAMSTSSTWPDVVSSFDAARGSLNIP